VSFTDGVVRLLRDNGEGQVKEGTLKMGPKATKLDGRQSNG